MPSSHASPSFVLGVPTTCILSPEVLHFSIPSISCFLASLSEASEGCCWGPRAWRSDVWKGTWEFLRLWSVLLDEDVVSEIRCAEESDDHDKVENVLGGFPFEIEDKSGYQTITLTREYEGEEIKVEVSMPDLVTGEEEEGGNDNDDEHEKANQSSIPLVVSVAKGNGPCLKFGCTAYPDEVVIDSLAVKKTETEEDQIAYEGPDFQDLDENLQKAFHKYLDIRGIKPSMTNFLYEYMINKDSREYLDIRGIKPSMTNFLYEYMINKDSREYLNWLKNLKRFVEA